jgi:hypothetical protein
MVDIICFRIKGINLFLMECQHVYVIIITDCRRSYMMEVGRMGLCEPHWPRMSSRLNRYG